MRPQNLASIIKHKLNSVIQGIAKVPWLFAKNPGVDFTRNRVLSIAVLLKLILSMGGNSINKEIIDFFGPSIYGPSASAFVQQRDKLLPDVFSYILHEFNNACDDKKLYKGYRLFATDGSTVTIATDSSASSYLVPNSGDKGINQLKICALYDLQNKTYADIVIQDREKMDERAALIEMAEHHRFHEKSIIIADRGYEGFNLFEHLKSCDNVDYLIRVKNKNSIKEIAYLPLTELDTDISFTLTTLSTNEVKQKGYKWIAGHGKNKPRKYSDWDFEPICPMTLRVVRFKITDDTYETIVTSLDRFQFPAAEIKKIYHMRWGIETSFRELKYVMGVVNFHCKKQEFAVQEIYARIIMYNFCERITLAAVIIQNKKRMHVYQVNFTMGIRICMNFFKNADSDPPNVIAMIAKYILPVRKGRKDKRNIIPKGFDNLVYRIA